MLNAITAGYMIQNWNKQAFPCPHHYNKGFIWLSYLAESTVLRREPVRSLDLPTITAHGCRSPEDIIWIQLTLQRQQPRVKGAGQLGTYWMMYLCSEGNNNNNYPSPRLAARQNQRDYKTFTLPKQYKLAINVLACLQGYIIPRIVYLSNTQIINNS